MGPVVKSNNIVNVVKISNVNISNSQYFSLKKCEKLLSFFQQKISVYLVIKL